MEGWVWLRSASGSVTKARMPQKDGRRPLMSLEEYTRVLVRMLMMNSDRVVDPRSSGDRRKEEGEGERVMWKED